MTREIDSALRTAIAEPVVHPVYLIELMYDTSPLRVHSGTRNITFQGNTYLGVGQFGSISNSSEISDQSTTFIDLTLSGIETGDVAIQLTEHYQGRRGTVWLGLRNITNGELIIPTIIFRGLMDHSRISIEGETASITVRLNSPLVTWDKPNLERYTSADQQRRYPNDKGFEYVPYLQGQTVAWGGIPSE